MTYPFNPSRNDFYLSMNDNINYFLRVEEEPEEPEETEELEDPPLNEEEPEELLTDSVYPLEDLPLFPEEELL